MEATVSLYHWMTSMLEFDAEMQLQLDAWAAEHPDDSWLQVQEEFAVYLHERDGHEKAPEVYNTYNEECCDLSQVIQYVAVHTEDRHEPSYLIVSVHGGCDVRGGYSSPRCYELPCFKEEYIDSPKIEEIREAITRCDRDYKGLPTDVDPSTLAAWQLGLEHRKEELKRELEELVDEVLGDEHDKYVFVRSDRTAYLCNNGNNLELTAGNGM